MKGYVYILSNKAMPGIFKIGYTMYDPAIRAKELEGSGVPHPFIIEYEIIVDDPKSLEGLVHRQLRDVKENKEWFRCDFSKCVAAIHGCYSGTIYYEKIWKNEREKELKDAMMREEEEKRKIYIEKERCKQEEQNIDAEKARVLTLKEDIEKYCNEKANSNFNIWLWLWGGGAAFLAAYNNAGLGGIISAVLLALFLAVFVFVDILHGYNSRCEDEWKKEYQLKNFKHGPLKDRKEKNKKNREKQNSDKGFVECPACWTSFKSPGPECVLVLCPNCKRHLNIQDGRVSVVRQQTSDQRINEKRAQADAIKYRQRINGLAICPGCSQKLRFPPGKEIHITCPKCGTEFDV